MPCAASSANTKNPSSYDPHSPSGQKKMFEIFLLIAATTAITAYARGRGGSPWLWGALTVGGYLLALFVAQFISVLIWREPNPVLAMVVSWGWVGVVALYTRFGLGAGKLKPSGMWTCSNCKYLNAHYAVICEACRQPYAESRKNRPAST